MPASYQSEGSTSYENLFAGEFPRATEKITLASGENLTAGALLGRIDADGKYILSLSGASDGSELPVAILLQDTDATAGDTETFIFLTGEFNELAMTFGTAHTADSVREGLKARSIFLRKNLGV